jgi:hypothetical protein
MIGLAIFGSLIAAVHYFAVDLPLQKSIQAPDYGIIHHYKHFIEDCGKEEMACGLGCKAGRTQNACYAKCYAENDYCEDKCATLPPF